MSLTKTFQGLKASTSSKNISSTCYARLRAGHFHIMSSPQENFPIKQKSESFAAFKNTTKVSLLRHTPDSWNRTDGI